MSVPMSMSIEVVDDVVVDGDGVEYGNLEQPTKRRKMGIDDVVDVPQPAAVVVGLQKKLISDEDLNFPSKINRVYLDLLVKPRLPAMADTFRTKNWSNLTKYWTDPSVVHLGLKEALQHELVAICVWFLVSNSSSSDTKVCVASALQIILRTEAPKPTNTSIDQAFVDALVVDALRSGDKEIIRQVCWTIYSVGILRWTDAFVGDSVQNELVELARRGADACFAVCLIAAINVIGWKNGQSCVMMKKLVEAVLSDRKWLLKLLSDPDDVLLLETYSLLERITRGKYDPSLWEALSGEIIPAILERCGIHAGFDIRENVRMLGIIVISNTINGSEAADYEIEELVCEFKDKGDIIWVMIWALESEPEHERGLGLVKALSKILEAGDYGGSREDNEFAARVTECPYGWDAIYDTTINSVDLLVKYAPLDFLRSVGIPHFPS